MRNAGRTGFAVLCVALCVSAVCVGPPALAGTLVIREGGHVTLSMKGTPSAGYTWRFDRGASAGLGNVEVRELGWREEAAAKKGMMGRPMRFLARVAGRRAGKAKLVFVYLRPWEKKPPLRSKVFIVLIKP